jgi:hypothetical protein
MGHYCGKQHDGRLKNYWVTELAYDIAIPPLNIYPKGLKAETQTGIYTPMFRGALVTTAKKVEAIQMSITDEQINKMWYIYI